MAVDRVVERLWAKDHTLWKPDPTEIDNRLGWLTVPDRMKDQVGSIRTFTRSVCETGIHDVVLLGMGGSSLGPEVLRSAFGTAKEFPRLWVLDSTVPGWIRQVTKAITPARTLFIVASKSGGTIEVMSLFAHFWALVARTKQGRGGAQFVAITDPGTGLERLATEHHFWQIFTNQPDIGGRYSVLSHFGLIPAALSGIDVGTLIARAESMTHLCHTSTPVSENPGAYLGAVMGSHALADHDKVTLITSPRIGAFGLWVEQLLAESTGKEGKGLIPIAGEPMGPPAAYGPDRLFVYLRLKGDANERSDKHVKALQQAGHAILTLDLKDRFDLGAEFFRWEFATAVAGHLLGIHPFDQPNVQESKDKTNHVLQETEATGALPTVPHLSPKAGLARLLAHARPTGYLAILGYMTPSAECERALAALRKSILVRYQLPTTAGYGPRYLHSTGQLHKGGPNSGLFLEVVESMKPDLPIPDKPHTFGILAQAQAIGDLQSLLAHGREAVRVNLGRTPAMTLQALAAALQPALMRRPPLRFRRSNRRRRSGR
ncbi:MAG: glucose-6-phosphate isomerase [Nitrospiraceae bacterium]